MNECLEYFCQGCKRHRSIHLFHPSAAKQPERSRICSKCKSEAGGHKYGDRTQRPRTFFAMQYAMQKVETRYDARKKLKDAETERLLRLRKERLAKGLQ